MTIDICINGENYLRCDSDHVPRVGETITIFNSGEKILSVLSVDHCISVNTVSPARCGLVTIDTVCLSETIRQEVSNA